MVSNEHEKKLISTRKKDSAVTLHLPGCLDVWLLVQIKTPVGPATLRLLKTRERAVFSSTTANETFESFQLNHIIHVNLQSATMIKF